jgi:hypothetical protein
MDDKKAPPPPPSAPALSPVLGSPPSNPPMLGRIVVGMTRPSLDVLSEALRSADDAVVSDHSRHE